MANPYHDETGKFCSRGEMLSAIQRLGTNGGSTNYAEYSRMRDEFEKIERKNNGLAPTFFGIKSKELKADIELTNQVNHAITYHYVETANAALVVQVKDLLNNPVDPNKGSIHRQISDTIYKFYDKNPAALLRSRTGDPHRTAAMVLLNVGRRKEIDW